MWYTGSRGTLGWMIGFIGTSVTISLNYNQYSTFADLHTLYFTVAHALGFWVPASCLLATDLNTETITSNHSETFLPQFSITNSLSLSLICCTTGISWSWILNSTACPVLSTKLAKVQSYVTADSQPASLSWNKTPIWGLRPVITVRQLQACSCGALSLTRGRICRLPESQSAVISLLSVYNIYRASVSPGSVPADRALSIVAPATTAV
jgi:hypothetical protein